MQTVTVTLLESLSQLHRADSARTRQSPGRRFPDVTVPPPASSETVPQQSLHGSRGRMVVCQIPVAGFAVYSFVRVRRMGVQCPVGVAEEQSCPGEGPFGKGGAHNPGGSRASGWRRLVNLGIFVPREGCLPATTTPLKGTALASDWCTNNKVRGLRPRSGRSPALGSARAPRGRTGLRFEALPAGGDGVHAGARGTAAKPWLG